LWPRREYEWIENGTLHISVPFTWCLPRVQKRIKSVWMPVKVGGPAVELMPDYLKGAEIGHDHSGVLQRINPLATRTTLSCPRRCGFCGIGTGLIEPGGFREIPNFVPGPVICDNNLLAASLGHVERVVLMLRKFGWADFNQGLDASRVTPEIADLLVSIGKPICRFAVDSMSNIFAFDEAYCMLRRRRLAKQRIRVYCLIGYKTDPSEAWRRCRMIERYGIKPLPMWFHPLDALEKDGVSDEQKKWGWTKKEQDRIMDWYYQHRMIA
jgi:hypothetical protein